jgi:hypothetical protein
MTDILHLYGQSYPHDDVLISADIESLRRLRDILIDVCDKKPEAIGVSDYFYTNDGEGYRVHINLIKDEKILNDMALPYSDPDFVQPYLK